MYLDYNATTPVAAEVIAAMTPFWAAAFANPSSPHPEARAAHTAVEAARGDLAALLNAALDEVVFTSGGTESNNWALRAGVALAGNARRRVVISAIEHPSVVETAAALRSSGVEVVTLPVDGSGLVRLDALDAVVDARTALVSVMLANNEIGTVQPVAAVVRRAHAVGALVHSDAAQAVGKISVNVRELEVDLLTVAGHKLYAPKGIGALYIRRGVTLPPLLTGGGQEQGRRSGTENVPGIVGLGMAARLAATWLADGGPIRQAQLRDRFEAQLLRALPSCRVFGRDAPRLPNTAAFALPDWTGAQVLAACPSTHAATGSACHSDTDAGSATIRALGVSPQLARGLVRISLGRETTAEDLAEAAAAIIQATQSRRVVRRVHE